VPRFNSEGEKILTVTNLYVKRKHGAALEDVTTFAFDKNGIGAGVACAPFRQVLIASRPVLMDCGLKPGDLRENVLVHDDGLYDLPSGTVVRLGQALIRLTFHCEPCKKILKLIAFDRIVHRRGVFGCFLNAGTISLGDRLVVTEQKFEPIPYAVKERIRWFLSKGNAPAAASQIVHAIGLPSSYARAMPRLLEKLLPVARA
jgi:MOSC domain-containing protein YiiM